MGPVPCPPCESCGLVCIINASVPATALLGLVCDLTGTIRGPLMAAAVALGEVVVFSLRTCGERVTSLVTSQPEGLPGATTRGLRMEPTEEGGATRERGGTPWHLGGPGRPDAQSGPGSAVPADAGPARPARSALGCWPGEGGELPRRPPPPPRDSPRE